MLATILKSKVATEVSIRIMDAFVTMQHYINYNKDILPRSFLLLENQVDENTKRIDELFDKFNPKEIAKEFIFFKGDNNALNEELDGSTVAKFATVQPEGKRNILRDIDYYNLDMIISVGKS